jgi:RimJ/RimL family protein N-acetyltransferase
VTERETNRIDRYRSEWSGLSPESLYQPGMVVVPHARPRSASLALVFVRGATCIVSVPPALLDEVSLRVAEQPPAKPVDHEGWRDIFPAIDHIGGPLYQGYAEHKDFRPVPHDQVRVLQRDERPLLHALAYDPTEWEHSGIDRAHSELFGLFVDDRLVAVAHYAVWRPYAASLGVVTHPAHRGQGYGKVVVSAAMSDAFTRGHLILYQALASNAPSIRLAETLGCRLYGYTLGIHLVGGV